MRACRTTRAFTLIELLTVVAIISLLISILTPSLSRARAQAKATACGARLHEMGLSLNVYANDHGGRLPVAEYDPDGPCDKFGWAELICQQNYRFKPPSELNEPFPIQYNTRDIGRYCFYYFNCPAEGKETDHTGHYRVYLPAWSYASFRRVSDPNIMGLADPRKSTALDAVPLQLPLLGDAAGGSRSAPTSYIGGGQVYPLGDWAYFDDERHYGRVNLLFPDGHNDLVASDPNNPDNFFRQLNRDWDYDGEIDDPGA